MKAGAHHGQTWMRAVQSRSCEPGHPQPSWPSASSAVELLRPLAPPLAGAAAAAAAASGRPRSIKRRNRQTTSGASKGSSASDRRLSSDSSAGCEFGGRELHLPMPAIQPAEPERRATATTKQACPQQGSPGESRPEAVMAGQIFSSVSSRLSSTWPCSEPDAAGSPLTCLACRPHQLVSAMQPQQPECSPQPRNYPQFSTHTRTHTCNASRLPAGLENISTGAVGLLASSTQLGGSCSTWSPWL